MTNEELRRKAMGELREECNLDYLAAKHTQARYLALKLVRRSMLVNKTTPNIDEEELLLELDMLEENKPKIDKLLNKLITSKAREIAVREHIQTEKTLKLK
ncbi:MAG: hypothetical protein RSB41_02820 [Bacilli bacterium]